MPASRSGPFVAKSAGKKQPANTMLHLIRREEFWPGMPQMLLQPEMKLPAGDALSTWGDAAVAACGQLSSCVSLASASPGAGSLPSSLALPSS